MRDVALAGAATGLLYWAEEDARPKVTGTASSGAALTAALASLRRTIVGIDCTVAVAQANGQATEALIGMRAAMRAHYGEHVEPQLGREAIPRDMTRAQLVELCNAWLQAYKDGYNASPRVFSAFTEGDPFPGASATLIADATFEGLSDLGEAVSSVRWMRNQLLAQGDMTAVDLPDAVETWRRLYDLAGEMDGADWTQPGVRPGDDEFQWSNVEFGLGWVDDAAKAGAAKLAELAGDAAVAVLSSSFFSAVVIGVVAWKVLKR